MEGLNTGSLITSVSQYEQLDERKKNWLKPVWGYCQTYPFLLERVGIPVLPPDEQEVFYSKTIAQIKEVAKQWEGKNSTFDWKGLFKSSDNWATLDKEKYTDSLPWDVAGLVRERGVLPLLLQPPYMVLDKVEEKHHKAFRKWMVACSDVITGFYGKCLEKVMGKTQPVLSFHIPPLTLDDWILQIRRIQERRRNEVETDE